MKGNWFLLVCIISTEYPDSVGGEYLDELVHLGKRCCLFDLEMYLLPLVVWTCIMKEKKNSMNPLMQPRDGRSDLKEMDIICVYVYIHVHLFKTNFQEQLGRP